MVVLLAAVFSPATMEWTRLVPGDGCSDSPADGCPEEKGCPAGDSDGACPPGCQICACCGHTVGTLIPFAAAVVLEERQPVSLAGDGPSTSPEPQGILHDPKRLLA